VYLHFTTAARAAAISDSGHLNVSRTTGASVYAAAVGGRRVPQVQHDLDGNRDTAVLFTTAVNPTSIFPEEAIWRRLEPLPITVVAVVSGRQADDLLDGSAAIPDGGLHP
jgi:hypothetical protein